MSRLATMRDFHAGEVGGGLYTEYRRYPFFAERADWIKAHYPKTHTILVVGCAYGYLVDELRQRGVDAWGIDASKYAVERAGKEIGDNARYVRQANALKADEVEGAFDLVVTEDVLTVCSDAEAKALAEVVRGVGREVLHIVTTGDASDLAYDKRVNWKTLEGWKALVGDDPVLDAVDWSLA